MNKKKKLPCKITYQPRGVSDSMGGERYVFLLNGLILKNEDQYYPKQPQNITEKLAKRRAKELKKRYCK